MSGLLDFADPVGKHMRVIAHPHSLVRVTNGWFLPTTAIIGVELASESSLDVTNVGRNRSLVPRTGKCGCDY